MNNQIKTLLILSLTGFVISGCASLTKEECLLGDWHSIGYSDGVSGNYSSHINNHRKACAKASVSPNYTLWEQGRKEGLKQYCTKSNAFNLGKQGSAIRNVCPASISNELQKINDQGQAQYKLKTQIQNNEKKYQKYQNELQKLKEGEMLHFKSEEEARKYMLKLDDKMDDLLIDTTNKKDALQKLLQNHYE